MTAGNGNGPSPESHTDFRGSLLALENNLLRKRLREVLDSADDGWELAVEFTINEQPLPKERARQGRGHHYTPKQTVDAEALVIEAFDLAAPLWEPITGPVRVTADFYRKNMVTADCDNLFKLVTDALNKVAYKDDKQIISAAQERYDGAGDNARTEIRIYIKR